MKTIFGLVLLLASSAQPALAAMDHWSCKGTDDRGPLEIAFHGDSSDVISQVSVASNHRFPRYPVAQVKADSASGYKNLMRFTLRDESGRTIYLFLPKNYPTDKFLGFETTELGQDLNGLVDGVDCVSDDYLWH